jgi:hypothetical protein
MANLTFWIRAGLLFGLPGQTVEIKSFDSADKPMKYHDFEINIVAF